MPSDLVALSFDANDPLPLGRFWASMLDRQLVEDPHGGVSLVPPNDTGFRIRFRPSLRIKTCPNQMHFDLTSTSLAAQQLTVARALELGGQHLDIGQRPEEGHVVLADPEGNEFCVVEPGNQFLAGCGVLGALSSDGSQAVGYFWSRALGWPLVWDQDQETAIQSPRGGTKISWGGPPLPAKSGRNRLRLDLAPLGDGDQLAEAGRLVSLGATRIADDQLEAGFVTLADPDGNEFHLLSLAR